MKKPKLPEGYSEDRIRQIAAHYDNQPLEEAVAEDFAAWGDSKLAWMQVPIELESEVRSFITQKAQGRQGRVAEQRPKYPK